MNMKYSYLILETIYTVLSIQIFQYNVFYTAIKKSNVIIVG